MPHNRRPIEGFGATACGAGGAGAGAENMSHLVGFLRSIFMGVSLTFQVKHTEPRVFEVVD